MKLEGKILDTEFKPIWKQVNKCFKKGSEEKRLEQYRKKEIKVKHTINKTKSAIYGWNRI